MPLARCFSRFAVEIKTISQQRSRSGRGACGSSQETDEEEQKMTRDRSPEASANLAALSDLCTPWCVHVVATLRIAEQIEAGTTDVAALATAAQCDSTFLAYVLRPLAGKGLFVEPEPGQFQLTEPARALLDPGWQLGL